MFVVRALVALQTFLFGIEAVPRCVKLQSARAYTHGLQLQGKQHVHAYSAGMTQPANLQQFTLRVQH